jgi:hypothetical protein
MLDFINAATYEDICDFSIMPLENKNFDPRILYKNAIIFCKTDYIDYLFNNIKSSFYKYILITHHSDYPIDFSRFSKKPNCIKKWFAINPTYQHEDLIAIPLGLKTHRGVYLENNIKTLWLVENIDKLKNSKKNEKTLYCNWSDTNPERKTIIDKFNKSGIKYKWETGLEYEKFCINMSKYKFVISPPGNGLDNHRTWEALYMGCIPIVIKDKIYDNWNLPIIQVKDYNEINQNLLDNFTYKDKMEQLYMNYWKNLIKENFNKL